MHPVPGSKRGDDEALKDEQTKRLKQRVSELAIDYTRSLRCNMHIPRRSPGR